MTLPSRPARPVLVPKTGAESVFSHLEPRPASPAFTGKPVQGGEKAVRPMLQHRLVVDGERTFHAYSADELMSIDAEMDHARPGLPY